MTHPNDTVILNGRTIKKSDLTVENFEALTGRRFRATAWQFRKIQAGEMTWAQALEECLNRISPQNKRQKINKNTNEQS